MEVISIRTSSLAFNLQKCISWIEC